MKLNPLSAALLGAGVTVIGTAGAFDLTPHWLKNERAARRRRPGRAASRAGERVVPAAPLSTPVGQVPNYRAIVKQSAPAVVGVTVEGTHKASLEDQGLPPGMEDDPFFKFFNGIPGLGQRGRAEPVDAVQGHGLGLHHQLRRPDPDQRARRARRQGRHRQAERPARVHAPRCSASTPRPTSPCCASTPRTCRSCASATRAASRSATRCSRSARRTASSRRRRRASSAPRAARCPATRSCRSSRPTRRSTPATPAARCSTAAARWSASTRRSTRSSGGFQGVSFAIPINVALKVKDQIVATGKAQHGRLGVTVQDLNQSLADSFGLKRADGALVVERRAGQRGRRGGPEVG